MISVITGDIINSRETDTHIWMDLLKSSLNNFGANPADWEIYRGDSFQLKIPEPECALLAAIKLKAAIKTKKNLDVRLSIGIGNIDFKAEKVTESNGDAFVRSGEDFERLKSEKRTLSINTPDAEFNEEMNLFLRLMLIVMDNWSPGSAEYVMVSLENTGASQQEIGELLGINQSSVSERHKRSYLAEILKVEEWYRKKINL